MTPRDAKQLAEIRQRSLELWRIRDLPAVDPETGVPRPFVVVSQSDIDVKFLLKLLSEAQDEITRLEDMMDEQEESELIDECERDESESSG